jgi:hypothetical protein
VVEVAELGVTILAPAAFDDLGVALELRTRDTIS